MKFSALYDKSAFDQFQLSTGTMTESVSIAGLPHKEPCSCLDQELKQWTYTHNESLKWLGLRLQFQWLFDYRQASCQPMVGGHLFLHIDHHKPVSHGLNWTQIGEKTFRAAHFRPIAMWNLRFQRPCMRYQFHQAETGQGNQYYDWYERPVRGFWGRSWEVALKCHPQPWIPGDGTHRKQWWVPLC